MADGTVGQPAIPDEARRRILSEYVTSLAGACRTLRIPLADAEYSERELTLALHEADIDLHAMFARRCRKDGISKGKIAGIVAYRLSRFKIVHFTENGRSSAYSYLAQDLAAIFAVRALLLRVPMSAERVLELAYQMSRRHANQETLGVVFDILAEDHG